ncbi:MAG: ribosome biogenesis GTPase Der [Longimicrobiales bacterium]
MRRILPTVALVGRPNVGKSTLFNRAIGQRRAIVEDTPGVTRDRNFARAQWAGRHFWVVDTGGLEPDASAGLPGAVRQQVLAAVEEADVIVFVVDGAVGPHPLDQRVAEVLRRADRHVILAVNKMDRLPDDPGHYEFWSLGLGEPYPVSALIGRGSGDLLDVVVGALPEPLESDGNDEALYVAVVGKPNVGKSSFVNRLLGEERMVVNEEAGTTRDSVDTPMRYHGRELVFVDTAGLRKQARIEPGLEYYSALRTERAVERADICLLLIDATEPMHIQDLRIAEKAWRSGCGLIIVANKWDLVPKETMTAPNYEKQLRARAPSLRSVPIVFTSALTGQRVHKVLELILEVAAERAKRIATREVNEVLRALAERLPPPHFRGMPVRLKYVTQAGTAPPTFVLFVNQPKALPESYLRYLRNAFRERWGFFGSPIRIRVRARREKKAG